MIFYYIDSFCIINTCFSRIINYKLCLILSLFYFHSWKVKKLIYILSFLFLIYESNITDKFYLTLCLVLNYLSFKNYQDIGKWTILKVGVCI